MNLYLLDTDTCSYVISNRSEKLRKKLNSVPMASVCISAVTYAELCYGVEKTSSAKVNAGVVEEFVKFLSILDWTQTAAQTYGSIRVAMEKKGKVIGNLDMMIAAHALSVDAIVVTNNVRHFKQVPGLNTENWHR